MTAELQIPDTDLSGETLDRYRLRRRLGVGGMGEVYEAEHTRLRKRFAVKLLRPELARKESARKRFLREARAASSITHPHIVGISDFGDTPEGQVFFVMELLEGRDLHELLHVEKRLSWPRTREILLQVTSAIQTAHEQGIVHRDIKPSNCFLADVPGKSDEDFVKVLDFGIAKLSSKLDEATARLTSTDELFGTVAYMAPEMANGVSDDHRSDIYALGVMMYRMLVGELPFSDGNAFQILSQHANVAPPPPRSKEPSILEGVEAIILKALAKDPGDRFGSMNEFGQALRAGFVEAVETSAVLVVAPPHGATEEPEESDAPDDSSDNRTVPVHSSGAPAVRKEVTVVSSPIGVGGSAVAPIVAPAGATVLVTPSPGHVTTTSESLKADDEFLPRKASSLGFALVIVGVAVLAGTVAYFAVKGDEDAGAGVQAADSGVASALGSVTDQEREIAAGSSGDAVSMASEVQVDLGSPPTPSVESPPPRPSEPKQNSATPPKNTRRTKPKQPAPPKPRPDSAVVNSLRKKIKRKCKGDGTTTVKVEGVISSSGKIGSLLVTPPTGPGACVAELVKEGKFDSKDGVRPIPRFSVKV